MRELLYRVQDTDGRGPFKPGFSDTWLDDHRGDRDTLPPWTEEFGLGVLGKAELWEHVGSAVRSVDGITLWFSPAEQERLSRLGFGVVAISGARIIAASGVQVLIASRVPFSKCSMPVQWPCLPDRELGK